MELRWDGVRSYEGIVGVATVGVDLESPDDQPGPRRVLSLIAEADGRIGQPSATPEIRRGPPGGEISTPLGFGGRIRDQPPARTRLVFMIGSSISKYRHAETSTYARVITRRLPIINSTDMSQ